MEANKTINELRKTRFELAYIDACDAFSRALTLFADRLITLGEFDLATERLYETKKQFRQA